MDAGHHIDARVYYAEVVVMSWIFEADDGEHVLYDVPPRVVELEQQLTELKAELKEAERNRWGLAGAYSDALSQLAGLRKAFTTLISALEDDRAFDGGDLKSGPAFDRAKRALLKQGGD